MSTRPAPIPGVGCAVQPAMILAVNHLGWAIFKATGLRLKVWVWSLCGLGFRVSPLTTGIRVQEFVKVGSSNFAGMLTVDTYVPKSSSSEQPIKVKSPAHALLFEARTIDTVTT